LVIPTKISFSRESLLQSLLSFAGGIARAWVGSACVLTRAGASAFAFHSNRFLFLYRKPAPPFYHPIPIQIPPRKNKNRERAKDEGGRAVLRAWGGMIESPRNRSARKSLKPPRARSVRLVISRIIAKICSNFF